MCCFLFACLYLDSSVGWLVGSFVRSFVGLLLDWSVGRLSTCLVASLVLFVFYARSFVRRTRWSQWPSGQSAIRLGSGKSGKRTPLSTVESNQLLKTWHCTRFYDRVGWLIGCLMPKHHVSVSQGRICLDNCTCCHTEIKVEDQISSLIQSQYTDTGPTSPSTDPITPSAWQGSHWSFDFEVTGTTRPGNIPAQAGFEARIFRSRGGRLNH